MSRWTNKAEVKIFLSLWGIVFASVLMILFVLTESYLVLFLSTLWLLLSLYSLIKSVILLVTYIQSIESRMKEEEPQPDPQKIKQS
jgi:uncharacterized membrane protein